MSSTVTRFGLEDKTPESGPQRLALQRVGPVIELAPLLAEQGVDPAAVFAAAGLERPPSSADEKLPFLALVHLLEISAEATQCQHFGLVLGQRFQLSHHGPIGELMRSAPTLGRAIMEFISWQPGYSSGAVVYLHRLGEDHAFGYGAMAGGSRVLHDLIGMIGFRMLDQLTGGAALPEEILFAHRQPADRAVYARYLPVPVRFNQHRLCFVLPNAALETRLPGADHARHQAIQTRLRDMLRNSATDLTLRTRLTLRNLLYHGAPRMDEVAATLAMHPRTLRRHLAKQQTSFEALSNATRFEMAKELLDLTDLPISEIGTALAYASPSVFADAFRRWSGLTPTEWRRRHGQAGPA